MSKDVFLRIVKALSNHNDYFTLKLDAKWGKRFITFTKCTTVIRILTYGSLTISVDEHIRISESIIVECLQWFVSNIYGNIWIWLTKETNNKDINQLLQVEAAHRVNWLYALEMKNCWVAWKKSIFLWWSC